MSADYKCPKCGDKNVVEDSELQFEDPETVYMRLACRGCGCDFKWVFRFDGTVVL